MRPRDAERRQRFEEIFEAYGADIVSYCSWRLGHAGHTQDAVADTL